MPLFYSSHVRKKLLLLAVLILGGSLLFSACNSRTPAPSAIPGVSTPQVSLAPSEAATPTQVETPTPSAPQVILLTSPESDPLQVQAAQEVLEELSAQDGVSIEVRTDLTQIEFAEGVRLVIVLPPDPGILNLAAANPQAQFLAFGIPSLEAAGNLSVIGSKGERPDQQGFLAGYLAAVITSDWRAGVISRADLIESRAARLGFDNGVTFFCGLCRPAYPPFVQYPQFVELTAGAGQAEAQTAVDAMIGNAVKTVYLAPGVGDELLIQSLAQAGVTLISSGTPPAQIQSNWAAVIRVDELSALRQIWRRLLNGEGGIQMSAPLMLSDVNRNLFSMGRQLLVEKMLADLLAGFIDTGVNPQTGELR